VASEPPRPTCPWLGCTRGAPATCCWASGSPSWRCASWPPCHCWPSSAPVPGQALAGAAVPARLEAAVALLGGSPEGPPRPPGCSHDRHRPRHRGVLALPLPSTL